MKSVYDRYGVYYQSDDNNIGMHLSISDNSIISVEIYEKDMDNSLIKITENAEIAKNIAAISFNDSLNQQGIIMIELTNDGINLNIRWEHAESKSVFFQLNEKSDEPILEQITAETIKDWLLDGITESDLIAKGYELEFEQPIERDVKIAVYKIKNTDISILDLKSTGGTISRYKIDDVFTSTVVDSSLKNNKNANEEVKTLEENTDKVVEEIQESEIEEKREEKPKEEQVSLNDFFDEFKI